MPEYKRSGDYRVIFANAFALRVYGNQDVIVTFGIDEDPANSGETILEQVSVGLNLRSMKLLGTLLLEASKGYEEKSGADIELPADKLAELREGLAAGIRSRLPGPESE